MEEDRGWMYSEKKGRSISTAWRQGLEKFLDHAFSLPEVTVDGKSYCPCSKCVCCHKHTREEMTLHLCRYGFQLGYERWTSHGEPEILEEDEAEQHIGPVDQMNEMLTDAIAAHDVNPSEEPTPTAAELYRLLEEVDTPVHENTRQTRLSIVARLMSIKTQNNMSEACDNEIMNLLHDSLGDEAGNKLPKNYHRSKKLVHSLGMPYKKIHACTNNCMLFYKENEHKENYTVCGEARYEESARGNRSKRVPRKVLRYLPITPRLQRLYVSETMAKHMRYHARPREESNVMGHPSDGEAWKEFDKEFPDFSQEVRNVRLCLATYGFTPFSIASTPYSCWPVFVAPYNLPPEMCTKDDNILLSLVIPGPEHPGKNLNVFMEPLVDELLDLWMNGAVTYNRFLKQNFNMKAAVVWTIHDIPAYGLVSCWSTHGKLACPICGGGTKAFQLKHGHKACWFDCHRRFLPSNHEFRRSLKCFRKKTKVLDPPPERLTGDEIYKQLMSLVPDRTGKHTFEGFGETHNWIGISGLWKLPYFKKLMLRHNIDVMHNEKNVAEAVLSTCLDIQDKTKDNVKARLDMADICDRPTLNMTKSTNGRWQKPRAKYCVTKEDKLTIMKWFKDLKFPDRFAANLKKAVNLSHCKFIGLKSHDVHIFIERLLPVALRGFIPEKEWKDLSELSFFYRQLCAKEIDKEQMHRLEKEIVVLLCKLEKMFPPGFFNSMQHLILHLPYEARVGGPVQFRWMYPFERYCSFN